MFGGGHMAAVMLAEPAAAAALAGSCSNAGICLQQAPLQVIEAQQLIQDQQTPWNSLDSDLLLRIAQTAGPSAVQAARLVCRSWRTLLDSTLPSTAPRGLSFRPGSKQGLSELLPALQELRLTTLTHIAPADLRALGGLQHLTQLVLGPQSQLDDAHLAAACACTHLRRLTFSNVSVCCAARLQLSPC